MPKEAVHDDAAIRKVCEDMTEEGAALSYSAVNKVLKKMDTEGRGASRERVKPIMDAVRIASRATRERMSEANDGADVLPKALGVRLTQTLAEFEALVKDVATCVAADAERSHQVLAADAKATARAAEQALLAALTSADDKIDDLDEKVADLQTTVDARDAEIDNLKSLREDAKASHSELYKTSQALIGALEGELSSARAAEAAERTKRDIAENDAIRAREEKTQDELRIVELGHRQDDADRETARLKLDLDAAKISVAEGVALVTSLRRRAMRRRKADAEAIAKLQSELATNEGRLDELRRSIAVHAPPGAPEV